MKLPWNIKWRPQRFKDLLGQKYIINIFKNLIKSKEIINSFLFTGPSGVGKTSLAKILVKCFNCYNGISYKFCNKCKFCKSINSNKFIDCIEIDATNNRGVDEVSNLLNNVYYNPVIGRFKIYIIDEFHMLSNHALSLMLKLLEELPSFVKFILITTEVNKIPNTIISRCMHFNFNYISNKNVILYLSKILIKIKVFFKKKTLILISNLSNGNLRNALIDTEKNIFKNKLINYKTLLKIFYFLDEDFIFKILFYILKKKVISILKISNYIENNNLYFEEILLNLINVVHKILLIQFNSNLNFKNFKNKKKFFYFSKIINPIRINLYYKILLNGYNEIKFFPNKYIIFNITLLKICYYKIIF